MQKILLTIILMCTSAPALAILGTELRDPSPLAEAARRGDLPIVKMLVERGESIEGHSYHDAYTPLLLAVAHGHMPVIRYLVEEANANIHALLESGETILAVAANSCMLNESQHDQAFRAVELTKYLLSKGATIKNKDGTKGPLHYATQKNNIELARYLLNNGANIEQRDAQGRTALFGAVGSSLEMTKFLIEKAGADPNTVDNKQVTLLHAAIVSSYLAIYGEGIVKYLVEKAHADVHAVCNYSTTWSSLSINITPLHLAAIEGYCGLVGYLIEKGARVTDITRNHETALHFAAFRNHRLCVELLIARGADVHAKTLEGKTPHSSSM